jgi:hypothetical protein
MKVSFDFDNTLSRKDVQQYAKELINLGLDVWICTSRVCYLDTGYEHLNNDLFNVALDVGIKPENIIFTNMSSKHNKCKEHVFLWHLDDDTIDIEFIEEGSKTIGVNVNEKDWKDKCNKLINENR